MSTKLKYTNYIFNLSKVEMSLLENAGYLSNEDFFDRQGRPLKGMALEKRLESKIPSSFVTGIEDKMIDLQKEMEAQNKRLLVIEDLLGYKLKLKKAYKKTFQCFIVAGIIGCFSGVIVSVAEPNTTRTVVFGFGAGLLCSACTKTIK